MTEQPAGPAAQRTTATWPRGDHQGTCQTRFRGAMRRSDEGKPLASLPWASATASCLVPLLCPHPLSPFTAQWLGVRVGVLKHTQVTGAARFLTFSCHPTTVLTMDQCSGCLLASAPPLFVFLAPALNEAPASSFSYLRGSPPASAPPHGRPPESTPSPPSLGSTGLSDPWGKLPSKGRSLNPSPTPKEANCLVLYTLVPLRNAPHNCQQDFNCAPFLSLSTVKCCAGQRPVLCPAYIATPGLVPGVE